MKIKITKEIDIGYDRHELLLEVNDELLSVYMASMGVEKFDRDSFNEWLEKIVHCSSEGDDWKYE